MARKSFVNKIVSIIAVFLLIGLIGGMVVWLVRDEGLTVYVECDNKRYTVESVDATLGVLYDSERTFKVGSITGEKVDYSVSVKSNSNSGFYFVANGSRYKWTDIDFTTSFDIQKQDDTFVLSVPSGMTVEKMLRVKYDGEVSFGTDLPILNKLFVLSVKTSTCEINIPFGLYLDDRVAEIVIDPENIVL